MKVFLLFVLLSLWSKVSTQSLPASLPLPLSDMLMLLILIGNRTEPSADKKTMLAAAHRFLPGALKGVLQTVSEFTGFSQSVVLQIVSTGSSGLCLTACFYQRGRQIVLYELDVCLCVCFWRLSLCECACRWHGVHGSCCVFTVGEGNFSLCAPDTGLTAGSFVFICTAVYSSWIIRLLLCFSLKYEGTKGTCVCLRLCVGLSSGFNWNQHLQETPFFFFLFASIELTCHSSSWFCSETR